MIKYLQVNTNFDDQFWLGIKTPVLDGNQNPKYILHGTAGYNAEVKTLHVPHYPWQSPGDWDFQ